MVSSAEEAIKVLYASKIDLAFVDVMLPGANGCELTSSFTKHFAESGTIFVACSSDTDTMDDLARLRSAGMSDVLRKPVKAAGLRATLNKWMPRNQVGDGTILSTPAGGLLRTLYVEDCSIQATAMCFLLNQLGLHVDTAETGAKALQMLCSSRRYHLVIIDLGLPDMSGFAVCSAYQQYCAEQGTESALTLALTAEVDDSPVADFGFAHRLTKPLSSSTIHELLRTWLTAPGTPSIDGAASSLGSLSLR